MAQTLTCSFQFIPTLWSQWVWPDWTAHRTRLQTQYISSHYKPFNTPQVHSLPGGRWIQMKILLFWLLSEQLIYGKIRRFVSPSFPVYILWKELERLIITLPYLAHSSVIIEERKGPGPNVNDWNILTIQKTLFKTLYWWGELRAGWARPS